ncbi:hypothetical protein EYF80_055747 [Liparis tanakae]|uniref:Uncharacterized protein n=1 Tax=Liparis tanakae TaxID=230148 RepID=A0A4Z2EYP0_9TELE|nr:hypothetical protein EYF80_055747 [Liparis tanakae]
MIGRHWRSSQVKVSEDLDPRPVGPTCSGSTSLGSSSGSQKTQKVLRWFRARGPGSELSLGSWFFWYGLEEPIKSQYSKRSSTQKVFNHNYKPSTSTWSPDTKIHKDLLGTFWTRSHEDLLGTFWTRSHEDLLGTFRAKEQIKSPRHQPIEVSSKFLRRR